MAYWLICVTAFIHSAKFLVHITGDCCKWFPAGNEGLYPGGQYEWMNGLERTEDAIPVGHCEKKGWKATIKDQIMQDFLAVQ